MDAERIAAIRARIAAATPGPWTARDSTLLSAKDPDDADYILSCCNIDDRTLEFIAAARSDVPDLLAALDAARGDVARLREALERVIEQADAVERDDTPTLDLLINAEAIARAALAGPPEDLPATTPRESYPITVRGTEVRRVRHDRLLP